ncbi:VOC family protein [Segeticoccus rhizosphaerae]|uniref:VOC family protein n=1 Tax=Segeticoccus rhizosphaerae TaxID=1104777 RepID=UPI0010C113F7|nr:VOC family protein [Ornithinicoccus soli]
MSGAGAAPALTGMQVNLFCHDVESCRAFYTRLGLLERFRAPAEGPVEHVEIEAAGTRIGLTSAEAANRLAGLGVVPRSPVSTELVLWCLDVEALHGSALGAGATEVTAPTDSPDGRLHYSWVRDPEGHQVKFVQPL